MICFKNGRMVDGGTLYTVGGHLMEVIFILPVVLTLVLTLFCQDIEKEEYSRAYSQALQEGEEKNNRIPIMLVGQGRSGKTSLMKRLLGLPFDKDELSTTGIDVNGIELTEQNAEDPWKKREVKTFMTSESEAKTVLYKKTAEYFDRGVQRNLEGGAPEPLMPVKPLPVKPLPVKSLPVRPLPVKPLPVKPLPVKPLLREEISKIKSHRSTEHDQKKVLRVFVTDFAGQSIYYDTHACFMKPHCPYVLVHDLSLKFDKLAVPRFKASNEEEEEEMNNPHFNTNLDHFTSWLKFLQGLGECQDQQFPDQTGYCTTADGHKFKRPPVLIALTHSDKVKGNDRKIRSIQKRIENVLSASECKNVIPGVFLIDNALEGDVGDDVRKFRRKLFDISNAVLNQETLMPVKWLDFEASLSRKLSPDCKYIPVDEAKQKAEACGVGEFNQAIKFLHRQGMVVHHSGSSKVVLDPHWLMNRFTKVISMPGKLDALSRHALVVFKQEGILFREYLKTLEDAELLEELMQKFTLIYPFQHKGKAAFYVPSVAPAMKPGKELEASNVPSLFVTFPRKLVPMGLFTKLQVKLISEWEKRFPKHQVTPIFYCNYSLLPLMIDGCVYDVCLIDLHEFIKVAVFPKRDGNHSKFASHLLATLKKCLDDLKSPDQLLFSMTSYDFEVKCTCCFGKEERKCSRHHEIQCLPDRCGHRHFWKLSDLQRFYNDQSPAICQSNKHSSETFDIKSVIIWLNTGKWLMLKAFLLCQF
ncbi:serine threonine- kinase roco4 [Paramuricea clavata]|uniref:Serine threonine- kinase roco4 n=1 Tax=Paramuricea clavata TaxID=317549 RepID=A0A7D9J6U3_PARCT|nr:serine threonine- kinase roco4 [Paramuricea clavata]